MIIYFIIFVSYVFIILEEWHQSITNTGFIKPYFQNPMCLDNSIDSDVTNDHDVDALTLTSRWCRRIRWWRRWWYWWFFFRFLAFCMFKNCSYQTSFVLHQGGQAPIFHNLKQRENVLKTSTQYYKNYLNRLP